MAWPDLPYAAWRDTRDTLHAHTPLLGKLALALAPPQPPLQHAAPRPPPPGWGAAPPLAPPEPQLQHAALRLTARGWETAPLPARDGSGALVVALDLRTCEAVVEHGRGGDARIPLTPNRSAGAVARDVLAAVRAAGGPLELALAPQETTWTTPLDEDEAHATLDPAHAASYLAAATSAAQVLTALRAPYRGRSTPVNAWWGSFDLSVSLFSGEPAEPPAGDFITRNAMDAEEVAVGWWPGMEGYPKA